MSSVIGNLCNVNWGGFNTLEWLGCVAIISLTILLAALIVKRSMNLSVSVRITQKDIPTHLPIPRGREKLLVTDDDPTAREAMNAVLTNLGYQVVCLESGEQTVAYLEHNGADLLLLDIFMHDGIDGIETYRRIRRSRPLQKAIILSGFADPDHVSTLRNLGIENYLIKPAPLPMLAHAIRAELDRP